MAIKIIEQKRNGKVFKNLKVSNLLPFEYVVFEKVYPDPKIGESQFGKWYNYGILVNEIVTIDPDSGEKKSEKFDQPEQVSFFARETIHAQIKDVPPNVPIKLRQIQEEGNMYKTYVVEVLKDVAPNSTAKNVAPEISLNDKIKQFKQNGASLEDTINMIKEQYTNVTKDLIKQVYESS